MDKFSGYLLARLYRIGSRSEGPEYALQLPKYDELRVIKKARPWENDAKLHALLGRKVLVDGELLIEGVEYASVKPQRNARTSARAAAGAQKLKVSLGVDPKVLWIDKQPGIGRPRGSSLDLDLAVQWPYRSIWTGRCPTTQLYDFWIEKDGKTVWQWSRGKIFADVVTPVRVPGGAPHHFRETWTPRPAHIKEEGLYTARALFIASGQEAKTTFRIRFAV